MATIRLKMGIEPALETSCISDVPETIENAQHSAGRGK
jgi:hypothetical protein